MRVRFLAPICEPLQLRVATDSVDEQVGGLVCGNGICEDHESLAVVVSWCIVANWDAGSVVPALRCPALVTTD